MFRLIKEFLFDNFYVLWAVLCSTGWSQLIMWLLVVSTLNCRRLRQLISVSFDDVGGLWHVSRCAFLLIANRFFVIILVMEKQLETCACGRLIGAVDAIWNMDFLLPVWFTASLEAINNWQKNCYQIGRVQHMTMLTRFQIFTLSNTLIAEMYFADFFSVKGRNSFQIDQDSVWIFSD